MLHKKFVPFVLGSQYADFPFGLLSNADLRAQPDHIAYKKRGGKDNSRPPFL